MIAEDESRAIKALACYTIMIEKEKSCIHYWMGDITYLDEVKAAISEYPCQLFLKEGVTPPEGWRPELKVTPGFVIDHPAYSLVFTRLAPRFVGTVYEHEAIGR